jgi:hypothetical protein
VPIFIDFFALQAHILIERRKKWNVPARMAGQAERRQLDRPPVVPRAAELESSTSG